MESYPREILSNAFTNIPYWCVGFRQLGPDTLITAFLKKGFRHCFAFGYDPTSKVWLLVDKSYNGMFVRAFTEEQFRPLLAIFKKTSTAILHYAPENTVIFAPQLLFTCVSAVVSLLSLDTGAYVNTPYRLYCYLIRKGATPIH